MSHELAAAIRALPERAWQPERDSDALPHWAEVHTCRVTLADRRRRHYLAIRYQEQGRLFADGGEVKHFTSSQPARPGRRQRARSDPLGPRGKAARCAPL